MITQAKQKGNLKKIAFCLGGIRKNGIFAFVNYSFYLTDRQFKFFAQRLKTDSINQPPFQNCSVTLVVDMFVN